MKNKFESRRSNSDAMNEYKIFKYLIGANVGFYDGGYINLWLEKRRRKSLGLKTPIYSLAFKPRHEKYSWFGYTLDPMADSIESMANRIILW